MLSSALGTVFADLHLLQEGFSISLNALGRFVKVIVESIGNIGVGVIMFALILKAITTPFDLYQRIKMRKQSLIMKRLKPDLEKLQKQYANDKQTYSMKMYELQKKNGYSIFGACLPMIVSLVVIIIAITAFQSYASYANLSMYEEMARGYNRTLLSYCVESEKDFRFLAEGETPSEEDEKWIITSFDSFGTANEDGSRTYTDGETGVSYTLSREGNSFVMAVESNAADKYISYTYTVGTTVGGKSYRLNIDKVKSSPIWEEIKGNMAEGENETNACCEYFYRQGSQAAADVFLNEKDPGFLWVKNVWYPDVSYEHPIQNYNNFKGAFKNVRDANGNATSIEALFGSDEFNDYDMRLTPYLSEQKGEANGYFILIILSIGLMLLSQFVTMKSQKDADKYQTVDGQGARTQKVMMIMMPIMFAVFGFLWSAAFTIYNIISSFLSIIFTLATNLIMGKIYRKKEEEEIKERFTRTVPQRQNPSARGKNAKTKK